MGAMDDLVNSADPSAGREQPDQSERAAIDQYLHLADLDRPDDRSSGWAAFVIPIVCYGMLIAIGIIFSSMSPSSGRNMMPMLWVIAGAIVAAICAIFGFSLRNWPIIVLGSIAAALLIATIVILRSQLFAELKKHFHH